MSIDINSTYSSYANRYANSANSANQTAEKTSTSKTSTQTSTRKTAADELAYLSDKYQNYSFVAANYKKGMQYGSSSTVNVAISPQFLTKMANDPELEKEYEENIAAMKECDERMVQMQAARGWKVTAQGWAIDKDGGISSWTVVTKVSNEKTPLEKMSENSEKIKEKNAEKKKEQEKIEKKRQENREKTAEIKEKLSQKSKVLILETNKEPKKELKSKGRKELGGLVDYSV